MSTKPVVRLRESRLGDGPRVIDIWCASVDATHDFLTAPDRHAIEGEVREFLPTTPLWLAVADDDRAIGFMGLTDGRVDALFIDPAHRGAGVGRALVQHAIALHGALATDVNEQNGQAIGFYRRLGFVPTGRSPVDDSGRPYPLIHMRREATA